MTRSTAAAAVVLAAVGSAASAQLILAPVNPNLTAQVHGQIIADSSTLDTFAGVPGLRFGVTNPNRGFDLLAVFDTFERGTADPDLQGPNGVDSVTWNGGNIAADFEVGEVLIVAENNTGDSDGVLDDPDDEATTTGFNGDTAVAGVIDIALPAGDLADAITFFLVDIEGNQTENGILRFFDDGNNQVGADIIFADFTDGGSQDQDAEFGNNHANLLSNVAPTNGGTFNRVEFVFKGSGAVSAPTFLPAPGAAALFGLGGLIAARRRRA